MVSVLRKNDPPPLRRLNPAQELRVVRRRPTCGREHSPPYLWSDRKYGGECSELPGQLYKAQDKRVQQARGGPRKDVALPLLRRLSDLSRHSR